MRHWQLDDRQRSRLAELEKVAQPTDWNIGEANALRLTATGEDRTRAETLLRRWGPSRATDRGAS